MKSALLAQVWEALRGLSGLQPYAAKVPGELRFLRKDNPMPLNFISHFRNEFSPIFAGSRAPLSAESLPYRIIERCRSEDASEVNQLIEQQLVKLPVEVQAVLLKPQINEHMIQITIRIMCAVAARASLVHLVSRLGIEKGIRSVRWESEPTLSPA